MKIVKKIINKYKVLGYRRFLLWLVKPIINILYSSHVSWKMKRKLSLPGFEIRTYEAEYITKEVTIDDLCKYDQFYGNRKNSIKDFNEQNVRAFATFKNSNLAFFHLFKDTSYWHRSTNVKVVLDKNEVYIFDAEAVKDERGKGIGIYHMHIWFKLMHAEGYEYAVSLVDRKNRASVKSQIRIGFQPILQYRYKRFLFLKSVKWEQYDENWQR